MTEMIKYGIYRYSVMNNNGLFDNYQVPIKVLEETEKSYKVQTLRATINKAINTIAWARKKNVKINMEVPNDKEKCRVSDTQNVDEERYWWQDI